VSEEPVLLEPRDVSNLPAKRINDRETWSDHLLVIQVLDQLKSALTSFL
jgi:hypothetical protein